MPHGGSLCYSSPVRMLLMHFNASPHIGGSYPREPPFLINGFGILLKVLAKKGGRV